MKKWIIWFLVLAFINFMVVPDYVVAGEPGMPQIDAGSSFDLNPAAVIGVTVILALVITGIAYLIKKHKNKTAKQPKDPDTNILPDTNLNNQGITPSGEITIIPQEQKQDTGISPIVNLDDQFTNPSGEIVLVQW